MNARKNTLSRKSSLSIERLEDRQMMAGDVTVSLMGGNLTINEASDQVGDANAVMVSQLPSGQIRVKGIGNQAGSLTLVNGQAQQDFTVSGTGSLVMNLGGGADSVYVGDSAPLNRFSGMAINTSAPNPATALETDVDYVALKLVRTTAGIQIITGASADYVNLTDTTSGAVGINTGDGASASVGIRGASTSAPMEILTGNGVDAIYIVDSTIGDGVGVDDLTIKTGAGADTVRMNVGEGNRTQVRGNLTLDTFASVGEADVDNVDMQKLTVDGSITAHFGGGDDKLNLRDIYAGALISLSGEDGKDTFILASVRSGDDFIALMGDGEDVLQMDYVEAADRMVLNGGVGFDTIRRNSVTAREVVFELWEMSNGLPSVPGISQYSKPIKGKG